MSPAHAVAGNHGLLVLILRQSWAARHAKGLTERQRRAIRNDIRHAIKTLRHNRAQP